MPSGKPQETGSERAARVGREQAVLKAIRLALPRQHEAIEAMEQLRCSALGRKPGDSTFGLRIIQPSGAGKSETCKQMVEFVESQPGRDPSKRPVLHVTLDTTGTPRSLVVSCLEALGDEYATDGTEALLLKRLRRALIEEGVELLIIDELNHCSEKVLGKDVSNTLKNMLTKGWVPIVFCGTSRADRLFRENRELRNRCQPNLSLSPLDPEKDAEEWSAFLAGMDEQIVAAKLLRPSGLGDPELAEALCIACGGLVGELYLVLDDAFCAARRRLGRVIQVEDLHRAVDKRYVLEGDLDANPLDHLLA